MKSITSKEEILKLLLDNAEEPDDIRDGVGTFVTYRVEYLINDIVEIVNAAQEQTAMDLIEEIRNAPMEFLNFHDGEMQDATFVKQEDLLNVLSKFKSKYLAEGRESGK